MILAIKEDYDMNTEYGVRPTSTLALPPLFFTSQSIPESTIVSRNIAFNLAAYGEPTKLQQDSSIDFSRDGSIDDENLEWIGVADWSDHHTAGGATFAVVDLTVSYSDDKLLHSSSLNPCNEQLDKTLQETKSKAYGEDFVLVDIHDDDDVYGSDGELLNSCSGDSRADSHNRPVQREYNRKVGQVWALPKKNPVEESSRAALSRSLLLLVSLVRNAVLR